MSEKKKMKKITIKKVVFIPENLEKKRKKKHTHNISAVNSN
jgi:hypothetical protein